MKFGDIEWGKFLQDGLLTNDRKLHLAPDDLVQGLRKALQAPPVPSAELPFMLISGGRRLASFNTWTHNLPSLAKKLNGNHAIMNATDGRRLGIEQGSMVRIVSRTGAINIKVELREDIRPSVVVVHQFWGHHYDSGQNIAKRNPGVNVNLLHSDQERDKFTGMPVFNGTPCKIEAVEILRA